MSFRVISLPPDIAAAVRRDRRSPRYGHPVFAEISPGTGPCRSCLDLFDVGVEERLLFTHAPDAGDAAVDAPGPVVIHSAECERFTGEGFPEGLRALPIVVEGRTRDGRVLRADPTPGAEADALIEACLADAAVDFIFLRHGEAGCHIARVERGA